MARWHTHGNVEPGVTTRLFNAVNEVMAHEPAGSRVTYVDIHTETPEVGGEGPLFRVFKNGAVDMGVEKEQEPASMPEPEPTSTKATMPEQQEVKEAGGYLAARQILKQLAFEFQQVSASNLSQALYGNAAAKIGHQFMASQAGEIAEIFSEIAASL